MSQSKLLEAFLRSVTFGDKAGDREAFWDLLQTIGDHDAIRLLDRCLTGELSLVYEQGFYWLSDEIDQSPRSAVADTARHVASLLASEVPVLLFVLLPTPDYPAYSIPLSGGGGLVFLPDAECAGNIVAHEVAHCIMSCRHHFLDEALAYWIEHQVLGLEHSNVGTPYRIQHCLHLEELGHLEGLYEEEIDALYRVGAEFIDYLVRHGTVESLPDIYKHIPLWTANGVLTEELDQRCNLTRFNGTISAAVEPFSLEEATSLLDAIADAYFAGRGADMEGLYSQALSRGFPPELTKSAALGELRALFASCFFGYSDRVPFDVAAAKALSERLSSLAGEPLEHSIEGTCVLMQLELLGLKQASSYMDIRESNSQITQLVASGKALEASHVEFGLLYAIFLLVTPPRYGGDHDLARELLANGVQDQTVGALIGQLVESHLDMSL